MQGKFFVEELESGEPGIQFHVVATKQSHELEILPTIAVTSSYNWGRDPDENKNPYVADSWNGRTVEVWDKNLDANIDEPMEA